MHCLRACPQPSIIAVVHFLIVCLRPGKRSKTKARQATAHKTRVPQDLPTPRHAGAAGATPGRSQDPEVVVVVVVARRVVVRGGKRGERAGRGG